MADPRDALVVELEALGPQLRAVDAQVDLVELALARIDRDRRRARNWRRLSLVAAVAAIVALLIAVIPPARHAVADLLGIGGERITRTPTLPTSLGTNLDLGTPISVDDAQDRAPTPLTFPRELGAPAGAFAGRPAGGISYTWPASSALPRVLGSDVGLLVTEFRGSLNAPLVEKEVPPGTTMQPVRVGDSVGFWLGGGVHAFFYVGPNGEPQRDTARLAGKTLVWSRAGVTYRLESALDRDAAIRMAERLVASG